MASYLVSGAAGFIGSSLVRALLHTGARVRGVDNLSTGHDRNLKDVRSSIDFRVMDVTDPAAARSACEGIDYVCHLAALPSVVQSMLDPVSTNRSNVDGTVNLLVASRDAGVKRFIFAASSSAYGTVKRMPVTEKNRPQPMTPYGVSKVAGEMYLAAFKQMRFMDTVSLRFFNIFGPRQDPTSPYSGVLARFMQQMLLGDPPTIFGDGNQTRDFTYVDDATQAITKACVASTTSVSGRVFNIGTGTATSINQAAQAIREVTGYRGPILLGPARQGDIRHSVAKVALAREKLGYQPVVSFKQGLESLAQWYSDNLGVRNPAGAPPALAGQPSP